MRDSIAFEDSGVLKALDTKDRPEKFNYILTNVPYGKGKYVIDESVIKNSRLEVNALIKVVKMLKPMGKGLVIVPDEILESASIVPLREWLIKNCAVNFIISIPVYSFAPYTKEKTYAIAFTKRRKPLDDIKDAGTEKIWTYIIDCDGYSNSEKRFPTLRTDKDGRWLHNELSEWTDKYGNVHDALIVEKFGKEQTRGEVFTDEWGNVISGRKYGFINISKLTENLCLLPEKYLRGSARAETISFEDFISRAETISVTDVDRLLKCIIEYPDSAHVKAGVLFDARGGCKYLTEEWIYNIPPEKGEDSVPVYPSSPEGAVKYHVSKTALKNDVFEGPALIVTRKGYAGKVRYIAEGIFTVNDDTVVIMPKTGSGYDISIEWFADEMNRYTADCVSEGGVNATFRLKPFLEQIIEVPDIEDQERVVEVRRGLKKLRLNI